MKRLVILLHCLFLVFSFVYGQDISSLNIKDMSWGMDFKIELEMENDSIYILDVKNLPHSKLDSKSSPERFTYYNVKMDQEFISQLKNKAVEIGHYHDTTGSFDTISVTYDKNRDKTLWSALHSYIGGNWIHFVNTMLYTIEKGYLDIRSPLMERPETNWKPDPPTESYLRTKKWDYYVPVHQRHAQKEYKIRKENGTLGDLAYIPEKFVHLFLNTNNWQYKRMIKNDEHELVARIDLVKLLLGANYLGKTQIKYIKNMVLKGVMQYSRHKLPSIIIFENYNAAVAMTLNEKGYNIKKIVFSDEDRTTEGDLEIRRKTINNIINNINEVNKKLFEKRLKNYYDSFIIVR